MSLAEPLFSSVKRRNNAAVITILEDSNLYNAVDEKKATLLHHAAKNDNDKLLQYLLDKGCNVDAQDSDGKTPLMLVVEGGRDVCAKKLISAGADIDVKDKRGKTVLTRVLEKPQCASMLQPVLKAMKKKCSSSVKMAKRLIRRNCTLDRAAYARDAKIIEYMLKMGVPILRTGDEKDDCYESALHVAVGLDDVETVRLLLNYGADPTKLNSASATPLYNLYTRCRLKQDRKRLEILKLLLNAGASLTCCHADTGSFDVKPLLIKGNHKVIRVILQSVRDFTVRDERYQATLLHYLARNDNDEIDEQLEHHIDDFDINAVDNRGQTPLHWAVTYGNPNMVGFLLDYGASKVDRALFRAFSSSDSSLNRFNYSRDLCVSILLKHNANPQAECKTATGRRVTLFDLAIKNKQFDRIKLIIAHLAILQKQGVPILKRTRSKINSYRPFKIYFKRCQQVLGRNLCGILSVFEILTLKEKKLAKYLKNEVLVGKLLRIRYKPEVIVSYRYYYKIILRRLFRANRYHVVRNESAAIINDISGGRLDPANVATEKILDYLDIHDLYRLLS